MDIFDTQEEAHNHFKQLYGKPPDAMFNGVPIFIHAWLPSFGPVKDLPAKQWHGNKGTGRYAARVRKKWLKRYGTKPQDSIYKSKDGIFMSAAAFHKFKTLIEAQTMLRAIDDAFSPLDRLRPRVR